MIQQKRDEVIYRLRLQVEFGAALSPTAVKRSGVGVSFTCDARKIQEDVVDVLDFVVGAVLDKLRSGNAVGVCAC